ncbi:MAG: GntR family transcriptional regulator, partial [Neisseria sp.]
IVAVSDPLRKEKRNIDSNSHHEHREILDLLLAGKRNRVTKVMRRHLGACMERLEQKLEM